MKKINYVFKCLALVVAASLAVTACTPDENYLYRPDNDCVTFEKNSASFAFSEEAAPIEIKLVRGVADKDLTLDLTLTQDEANVFSISSNSVHFPAGEYRASVNVSYIAFADIPVGKHSFTVSFDPGKKSPAGSASISGAATKQGKKPAGDGYMPYATVEFWSSRMNSHIALDAEQHSVLQVSYDNKNDYRIKNIINSGIDLYINVDPEDGWTITGPEPEVCPYDGNSYIKIPSTIMYEGEPVTFWFDANPKYLNVYDMGTEHGEEYTMSMGDDWYTELKCYVWMSTPSKGVLTWPEDNDGEDDGWWPLYYDVIDFKPMEEAKWEDYATVEFWHKQLNDAIASDAEKHSVLQKNSEDASQYRIVNIANSGITLNFTLEMSDDPDDGTFYITGPEPVDCPYEDGSQYVKIPTSIMYEGEQVTLWIDQTPKYCHVYDNGGAHGAEFSMSMGDDWYTELKCFVWATTESKGVLTWGDDDDGWWSLYYDVVELKD